MTLMNRSMRLILCFLPGHHGPEASSKQNDFVLCARFFTSVWLEVVREPVAQTDVRQLKDVCTWSLEGDRMLARQTSKMLA